MNLHQDFRMFRIQTSIVVLLTRFTILNFETFSCMQIIVLFVLRISFYFFYFLIFFILSGNLLINKMLLTLGVSSWYNG